MLLIYQLQFIHSFTTRVIVLVKVRDSMFNRETCLLLDCENTCCIQFLTVKLQVSCVHSTAAPWQYSRFTSSTDMLLSIRELLALSCLIAWSCRAARKWFEGWKLFLWMMIPQLLAVIWFTIYYFVFGPTPEFTDFIRHDLFDDFDIDVDDFTYVGPYYYPQDKEGIHELDWTAFWAMTLVWILVVSWRRSLTRTASTSRESRQLLFSWAATGVTRKYPADWRCPRIQHSPRTYRSSCSMHLSCNRPSRFFSCTCQLQWSTSAPLFNKT